MESMPQLGAPCFHDLKGGLEDQYSQENAKNQNDQENCDGNEKQNFRNASGARSDIRETEKPRND